MGTSMTLCVLAARKKQAFGKVTVEDRSLKLTQPQDNILSLGLLMAGYPVPGMTCLLMLPTTEPGWTCSFPGTEEHLLPRNAPVLNALQQLCRKLDNLAVFG